MGQGFDRRQVIRLDLRSLPTPSIDRFPEPHGLKTDTDQMTWQFRGGAQFGRDRTSACCHGWDPGIHETVRQESPLVEPSKAAYRSGVVHQPFPIDLLAADADEVGVVEELP